MLRVARPDDQALIERLWLAPESARWIEPAEPGQIAAAIDNRFAFLWEIAGQPVGMAVIMTWVPQVYGLSALVSLQRGQGEPFLRALLARVFGPLQGHRIGFDVTVDNERALRLYDRVGFQREGLLRECWRRDDGQWVDCYLLGLLAREYTPLANCGDALDPSSRQA